ncbi:hypothetical protein GCM10017786_58040 [Amycolatopsis deserti]|uniref:Lantibiotic dehydratase N-terminal domain-containing protein n=1 Tax=Amycolatopsis deserti TaxID=185696 RepID=A0ABQ3JGY4_9PSEU|nr:hypothetical protein [Amycolatopsis deserti]GHF16537.1 hypothetical protein GCM10017786_58040 [Amycolatopsis deserti]
MTDPALVGAPGLVRVAGLPAALPAALGTPDLTERMRHLIRAETAYRVCAAEVAERIGEELVPALPRDLRRQALKVRRRLHRGGFVQPGDLEFRPLARIVEWGAALAAETAALHDAVEKTERMHHGLVWDLIIGDPAAARMITATAPGVVEDVRARLAAGEPWTSKPLRKRADYLLRLLFRAAFETTPRGWLAHVALAGSGPGPLTVGDHAVHRLTNIQEDRRRLTTAPVLPDAWLSLTPLRWTEGDRLCWHVADHDGPDAVRRGDIRRTPVVDALCRVLGSRAMRTREVVTLLAPDARQKPVLREFLRHLAQLGLVQVSSAPTGQLRRRRVSAGPSPGFTDVHRRAHGGVAVPARLPELVAHAGRLAAVIADRRSHPALELVGPEPRPVSEIVTEALDSAEPLRPAPPASAWPEPRPRTIYQRLCEWLARHADESEIELGPAVLDYLGAPPARPSPWPVDCLLRPLPAGRAVLEAVTPAGVADARFAAALQGLHGEVPQVSAYRAFLTETAARCGAELVEILVPPQGSQGTNAVRRPRYTRSWTGDADPATYVDDPAGMRRYLPLGEITLRRDARGVIAEDRAGRELWPVYHATRRPPPPWDVVVSLLTAASPAKRFTLPRVFGDPRAAFPGRTRTPRLLLDPDLVIAPATVFAGRDLLPEPGGDRFARMRALANLRLATGVPRWVFARHGNRSRPVDLDSVATLRVFDRMLADPGVDGLVLEEMLPAPEDLTVSDVDGGRCAAQVLVRLPLDVSPCRLADDVTAAWRRITTRRARRAPETTVVGG